MAGERVLGPTIVADGVSKVIDTTTLLGPTDLHVEPGTCTVVRGRNGIGKTTLLRALSRLTLSLATNGKMVSVIMNLLVMQRLTSSLTLFRKEPTYLSIRYA